MCTCLLLYNNLSIFLPLHAFSELLLLQTCLVLSFALPEFCLFLRLLLCFYLFVGFSRSLFWLHKNVTMCDIVTICLFTPSKQIIPNRTLPNTLCPVPFPEC